MSEYIDRIDVKKAVEEEALKDLPHELGYSHIWKRLREIEDILGTITTWAGCRS